MKKNITHPNTGREKGKPVNYPGYPEYSTTDDIYFRGKEASDIDPEDIIGKDDKSDFGKEYEDELWNDVSGEGPDFHGSEIDDELEIIDRDDEDNYYSIRDDAMDDLEDLIE